MSICRYCGNKISDNQKFCSECGGSIRTENDITVAGSLNVGEEPICIGEKPIYNGVKMPMKWFKFLIYFSLFASALVNLSNGLQLINGSIYFIQSDGAITAEKIYSIYGSSLKVLDVTFGILTLLACPLAIYTRMRLAKFHTNGPTCLYVLHIYTIATTLIYYIIFGDIIGNTPYSNCISTLISQIALLVCHYKYFSKRSFMFLNP